MSDPILSVEGLRVAFPVPTGGTSVAVDGVSFSVSAGEMLGIVGEFGCGKSVTALAIMGLISGQRDVASGSIRFKGQELLTADDHTLRDLRGAQLAMIFQEPMTSLNPSYTIGDQISEVLVRHRNLNADAAWTQTVELLSRVGIPDPAARARNYPHNFSGGMRQRAMIAMAIACDPQLIIADEPTTALDVTIQAQILELLRRLRAETGAAVIMITHDLAVVAEVCERVLVFYAGQVVEAAPVADLFAMPQHPYTVGLLGALPQLQRRTEWLATIAGQVPDMADPPPGCRFASRCPFAEDRCRAEPPALREVSAGRLSRCIKAPLERVLS